MTVKYSSLFTVTGAITKEPVTIRVELVEAEGFQGVCVESLEGEHGSQEAFKAALNPGPGDRIYSFLPLTPPGARRLVDMLNEALAASEGS